MLHECWLRVLQIRMLLSTLNRLCFAFPEKCSSFPFCTTHRFSSYLIVKTSRVLSGTIDSSIPFAMNLSNPSSPEKLIAEEPRITELTVGVVQLGLVPCERGGGMENISSR